MNKIKKGYAYMFCFIYKYLKGKDERSRYPSPIPLSTRTHILFALLEILFMGTLAFWYIIIFKEFPKIEHPIILFIPYIMWSIFDLYFFRSSRREFYLMMFSSKAKKKMDKWDIVMRVIIFLVIANFLISIYLLSER